MKLDQNQLSGEMHSVLPEGVWLLKLVHPIKMSVNDERKEFSQEISGLYDLHPKSPPLYGLEMSTVKKQNEVVMDSIVQPQYGKII